MGLSSPSSCHNLTQNFRVADIILTTKIQQTCQGLLNPKSNPEQNSDVILSVGKITFRHGFHLIKILRWMLQSLLRLWRLDTGLFTTLEEGLQDAFHSVVSDFLKYVANLISLIFIQDFWKGSDHGSLQVRKLISEFDAARVCIEEVTERSKLCKLSVNDLVFTMYRFGFSELLQTSLTEVKNIDKYS